MVLVEPGPLPFSPATREGVTGGERDAGPLLRAPLRGRPGCEDPPATSAAPPGAPSRDAQAWPVGRPGALFSLPSTSRGGTQQAAWALQDVFIYLHGSSALSTELKESGSSVGGLLTAASA